MAGHCHALAAGRVLQAQHCCTGWQQLLLLLLLH
jgi:hypothetical protein